MSKYEILINGQWVTPAWAEGFDPHQEQAGCVAYRLAGHGKIDGPRGVAKPGEWREKVIVSPPPPRDTTKMETI